MKTKLNFKQLNAFRVGYHAGYENGFEDIPSQYDDEQRASYRAGYEAGVADYSDKI